MGRLVRSGSKRIGIVCAVVALGTLLCSVFALANEEAESKAVDAASSWLELVDAGQYDESWENAAAYFKKAVDSRQWRQSLSSVRAPMGKVVQRKLVAKQYAVNLPGAPDGEYVVLQYETVFENKKFSIETVTPMLDADGKWRVSGYYIK